MTEVVLPLKNLDAASSQGKSLCGQTNKIRQVTNPSSRLTTAPAKTNKRNTNAEQRENNEMKKRKMEEMNGSGSSGESDGSGPAARAKLGDGAEEGVRQGVGVEEGNENGVADDFEEECVICLEALSSQPWGR